MASNQPQASAGVSGPGEKLEVIRWVLYPLDLLLRLVLVGIPLLFAAGAYWLFFSLGGLAIRWLVSLRDGRVLAGIRSALEAVVQPLVGRVLKDPRDALFLHVILWTSLLLIPSAVHLFVMDEFSYLFAGLHLAGVLGPRALVIRFIFASIHQECHRARGIFKPSFRIFDRYITWVLGPLIGELPEIDRAGHACIHHSEVYTDGDVFDMSALYNRASLWDFSRFVVHRKFWYQNGLGLVWYCWKRGLRNHLRRLVIGLSYYAVVVGALTALNWKASLVVFWIPFVFCLWFISIINWAQHAFVDPADPENPYKGATTLFDPDDIFAEGFHMTHHLKASRHYSEQTSFFDANREAFGRQGALLFDGLSWFDLWVLLMLGRIDRLADHMIPLVPGLGRQEILEMLRTRTSAMPHIPASRRAALQQA